MESLESRILYTFYCLAIAYRVLINRLNCVSSPADLDSVYYRSNINKQCVSFKYTKQQLMCISNEDKGIDPRLSSHFSALGKNCKLKNIKTKRGKRGGRRKQRHINVVYRPRPLIYDQTVEKRGVSAQNLIYINTSDILTDDTDGNCKILYLNAQSVGNKTTLISDMISEAIPDLVFITETWLHLNGDDAVTSLLTPPGYKIHSNPRQTGGGGGVCLIFRDMIHPKVENICEFTSFECIKVTAFNTIFYCIYHPPPKKNKSTHKVFVEEFADLLDASANKFDSLIFLGDFNLHFDNPMDTYVRSMTSLLSNYKFHQMVDKPTHRKLHILDWLITREDSNSIYNINVSDKLVSDHFPITFSFTFPKPRTVKRQVTSRNIKSIDLESFTHSIQSTLPSKLEGEEQDLAGNYNRQLIKVLDEHAPLRTLTTSQRPAAPWYTLRIKEAKQQRRAAERRWRKTQLTVHKQIYESHVINVKEIINSERKSFYSEKIANCKNSKVLFTIANEMKGISKSPVLPNNTHVSDLPDKFGKFFFDKVSKIRHDLDSNDDKTDFTITDSYQSYNGTTLDEFKPVTKEEIKKLIMTSPPKSCSLDPIPTTLLVQCLGTLLDPITCIINQSLQTGQVPSCFKNAIVTPLLKKANLDPNDMKNYRPVSNLPFLSKILEKVVLAQLKQHLRSNDLIEPFQSAYREGHSTETALLRIFNDILSASDEGRATILTLLDLSSAFDTIDHAILVNRLSINFGISGNALTWLTSYLTGRSQTVSILGKLSTQFPLLYGVPQGSVLGPILYTLYTFPLSHAIRSFNIDYHMYADDTQLYKSSFLEDLPLLASEIENCCRSVKSWMENNKLKLNNDKTEIVLCSTKTKLDSITINGIQFEDTFINFSSPTKNLGVFLDSTLSMEHHVNNLVKLVFFELRKISRMKPFLTTDAIKTLVTSLVLSRLDYCNSLLVGLQDDKISKLQRAQNCAARLILGKSKYHSCKDLLKTLHWLPIRARIEYKISLMCYNVFYSNTPNYLSEILKKYIPDRVLRSQDSRFFVVPRCNLKRFGERSFSFIGPTIWNSLPVSLRFAGSVAIFKKNLKTYLYQKYLL